MENAANLLAAVCVNKWITGPQRVKDLQKNLSFKIGIIPFWTISEPNGIVNDPKCFLASAFDT